MQQEKLIKQNNFIFVLLLTYLIFLALSLLPIWINKYLPLQDYASHLSRMYIISNIQTDTYLQQFYNIKFEILPNLAMDLIVPVLSKIFPLEISGKIMVSLVIIAMTSGSFFLNYVLSKRMTFLPLLSFLFVFNEAFIKGFINFLFGVGVAIWCIGLWILMRRQKQWLKIIVFNILSTILFFCHLYVLGIYVVTVVIFEFSTIAQNRNLKQSAMELLTTFSQFIIPTILYFNSPTSGSPIELSLASIYTKLFEYPLKTLSPYKLSLNKITLSVLIIIIIWEFYRKRIVFKNSMLLPILALVLIYFLIPQGLSTGANTDWRLLIPLALLTISSMDFSPNYKTFNIIISTVLVFLFSAQTYIVTYKWMSYQNQHREIVSLIERIETGSRIFYIRGFSYYIDDCYPFMQAATYAIIKKSAFVPSLFAFEAQQPVRFNTKKVSVIRYKNAQVCPRYEESIYKQVDWSTLVKEYDYVLLGKEEILPDVPKSLLTQVFAGKNNVLYKTTAK